MSETCKAAVEAAEAIQKATINMSSPGDKIARTAAIIHEKMKVNDVVSLLGDITAGELLAKDRVDHLIDFFTKGGE